MKIYRNLTITALFLSSLGCTQKFNATNATIKEALFGFESVTKSVADITKVPYASSYVTIGDGPQAFVILTFPESAPHDSYQTQLKWISADRSMIVTENGRLVKTLGLLDNNLAGVKPKEQSRDPLTLLSQKPKNHNWNATFDWQPNYRYGYSATIHWVFIEEEKLSSDAWKKEVLHYQETVTFPSLDAEYINHFWLDKQTNRVVKSIQHIGPNMPAITMTILKPYAG